MTHTLAEIGSMPQGVVDTAAGFGDAFGAGYIRDWLGVDGGINYNSIMYQGRYWRIGPGAISRTAGTKPFNYGASRNILMLMIGNGTPGSLNQF